MNRRDNICSHQQRLKKQLHEQLCVAYPSYKGFFGDISRATALYFWLNYPSPEHLRGKTAEELASELRPISHNNCSIKRAEKILERVRTDGQTAREHQASRDAITRSIAGDLEHYREQLKIVESAIETMLPSFRCTLMTMPGVDVTTAANMLSEIGDIHRFPNADKLAKFTGICPIGLLMIIDFIIEDLLLDSYLQKNFHTPYDIGCWFLFFWRYHYVTNQSAIFTSHFTNIQNCAQMTCGCSFSELTYDVSR